MVREIGPQGQWYCIVYSRLSVADADAVISREVAGFQQLLSASNPMVAGTIAATEFEWKVYAHDSPADLKERLARHRFDIGEEEALLVLDLARTRPASPRHDVDVRLVESAKELSDARTVWESVFEKDFSHPCSQIEADLALPADTKQHVAFVAYDADRPVSAARATFHAQSPFVGLWTGGTLSGHRGRGFYQALVAARAGEALRRGKRYLTVDARPTSLPILLRRGFERLSTTWPCVWRAAGTGS